MKCLSGSSVLKLPLSCIHIKPNATASTPCNHANHSNIFHCDVWSITFKYIFFHTKSLVGMSMSSMSSMSNSNRPVHRNERSKTGPILGSDIANEKQGTKQWAPKHQSTTNEKKKHGIRTAPCWELGSLTGIMVAKLSPLAAGTAGPWLSICSALVKLFKQATNISNSESFTITFVFYSLWTSIDYISRLLLIDRQSITFIIRVFAILLEFIVLRDFSGHSAPTWSSPMRNASDSTSNAVYHWNLRFFLHKKRIEKVWKSCRCCWDFARLLTSESVDFCVDFFTFMFSGLLRSRSPRAGLRRGAWAGANVWPDARGSNGSALPAIWIKERNEDTEKTLETHNVFILQQKTMSNLLDALCVSISSALAFVGPWNI